MKTKKIKKRSLGSVLQKRADYLKDQKLVSALLNCDIKGLPRNKAIEKLDNIVDEFLEE